MEGASSLSSTLRAQADFRRITSELADLQAQIASGRKADDLVGLGAATTPILSAAGLMASIDARKEVVNQIGARLDVQSITLRKASESTQYLAQEIRTAIAAGDGRGVVTALELAFNGVVQALNETWNGQPLFAGERQGVSPVTVSSMAELAAAPTVQSVFDESIRDQMVDLGDGLPIKVSSKASALATDLFTTLRDLQAIITLNGGSIGNPIDAGTQAELVDIAARLDRGAETITNEEARVGQLQKQFEVEQIKLTKHSDLLAEEVDKHAGADLAQVSIRLNVLMAQYEAAAKTFAELSKLTLLDYL